MSDALNALGASLDAFLLWLRVPVRTTLSRAELVFSPFIIVAFLFHLRNSAVMYRLWRRLRAAGQDEELRDSARERFYRAVRGMLRLTCWMVIVWALAVNWEYTLAAFTLGILAYGVIEAIDAGLDWVYQYQRARYWERRDAMEDYAQQVAARAEAAASRAESVADTAAGRAQRIEVILETALAAIRENTALTKTGIVTAEAALEASNSTNTKILNLNQAQADMTAQQAADRREDRADVAVIKTTTVEIKETTEDTGRRVQRIVPDPPPPPGPGEEGC